MVELNSCLDMLVVVLVVFIVGRSVVVVVRKSCCFVAVAEWCIVVVENITVSVGIVEIIGVVLEIDAVGKNV